MTFNRRNFLKSTAALSASSWLVPSRRAVAFVRESYQNWSTNINFNPRQVESPTSIQELSELIRSSSKVKVVGSRHSFNDIAATPDTWINLRQLKISLETREASTTVELPGAMTLFDANRLLESKGIAFNSIGEIEAQCLAGLAATSTHGTGLAWGTLSDSVVGMKIVTGTGEYREITAGEELAAAKTHLGALGAIVSITYEVGTAHNLERHRRFMPENEALDLNFLSANDHSEFYYLPFTEQLYVKTLNRTSQGERGLWGKKVSEYLEENLVLDRLLKITSSCPDHVPGLMKFLAKQFKDATDVGPSYVMMTSQRSMRYHEMEMALDLRDLPAAFRQVKEVIQELASSANPDDRFYAHLPVTVRMVKGCPGNYLSPTLGRDTAYISVSSHVAFAGYDRYFRAVEAKLQSSFQARPHWAKHFYQNPVALYPQFAQFSKVQKQLDPEGKFLNPYLDRLVN